MAQVLAVISGKGGTGKTSLCAGVASCLAIGFLTRTPRGRCVTPLAYEHLHLPSPVQPAGTQLSF